MRIGSELRGGGPILKSGIEAMIDRGFRGLTVCGTWTEGKRA
jgi:hypothetical protein